MTKWLLIGHRGVGKSQLLMRLKAYLNQPQLYFFDLDEEIEKKFKKPVFNLFSEVGEQIFRDLEWNMYLEIHDKNADYIISCGAGFTMKKNYFDENLKVLWVCRESDALGRIFFDRPRLNSKVSHLEEFSERFSQRQSIYQSLATHIYMMPEGMENSSDVEQTIFKSIFNEKTLLTSGILTLSPWHFKTPRLHFLEYQCDYYEVRDDLLDPKLPALEKIPRERKLLSFRDPQRIESSLQIRADFELLDWALELGACPDSSIHILSNHTRLHEETLLQFLTRLELGASKDQHLKASPEIETYKELSELFDWQAHDPKRRSILPRSASSELGRWLWVRLYQKGRQRINFWRDGQGSSPDQPTLFTWFSTPNNTSSFAALLGNPVVFSKTMTEQAAFFLQKNLPVWPILLHQEEFKVAMTLLFAKGLKAAAVTAPLKTEAFDLAARKTSEAEILQSVNTLAYDEKIYGDNTDLYGFQKLIQQAANILKTPIENLSAVVWGGGGTLQTISKVLPQALAISVRTRNPRIVTEKIPEKTQILIWAASPKDPLPPRFSFDLIVDLNYREDSRARELAINSKKIYLSGEIMFKFQAEGQRQFWQKNLKIYSDG